MPALELFRTRDCVIWVKGETITVSVDSELILNGWKGASGVAYTPVTQDQVLVSRSNGLVGGFLLWGSDESSDQYTGMTENQPYYGFAVLGMGAWLIGTPTFEQYTYASRQVGPLVPITYNANDILFFSLRGYWTNEDEWALSANFTGTFAAVFGSSGVPTTSSQVGVLVPGNPIIFASDPGVTYTVLSVTATSLTLTTPYTGATNLATTASRAPSDNVAGFVAEVPSGVTNGYMTIQVDI